MHCTIYSGFLGLLCIFLFVSVSRLHREALKQSAVDPRTGTIDIGILTTGLSATERTRRSVITKALRKLLEGKGAKVASVKYQQIFNEMKENSDAVSAGCQARLVWFVFL